MIGLAEDSLGNINATERPITDGRISARRGHTDSMTASGKRSYRAATASGQRYYLLGDRQRAAFLPVATASAQRTYAIETRLRLGNSTISAAA